MNGRSMNNLIISYYGSATISILVHTPIIHVASAVTDTDETYGAYVTVGNNTFNNTNNSNSNDNKKVIVIRRPAACGLFFILT